MIGKLRRRKPWRLSRDRSFNQVLNHRGGGCKQVVCELSLIVNHDTSLVERGKGGVLWRGGAREKLGQEAMGLSIAFAGEERVESVSGGQPDICDEVSYTGTLV
jgi:hypothetical protein